MLAEQRIKDQYSTEILIISGANYVHLLMSKSSHIEPFNPVLLFTPIFFMH